ncbi:hypothetical protein HXX76_008969 [Chlamydomonas incerta]|uniref:F-box domain-containing protein n=1 Tax=Chlamydomonas incerta TaxID=51695 RepID=A0A835W0L8_CHLIN|nr:hypothetical protein HXX76_008969 [Chlamydomonas incerta]|eukprot:KAG2432629.1 hypothetical protein HXX76_008969 [Chlamydomonas incerta]
MPGQVPGSGEDTHEHPVETGSMAADADPSEVGHCTGDSSKCPLEGLPAELLDRIAHYLDDPNTVACTLRLLSRTLAAHFRSHTAVRLSLPVPHHAFVRRFGSWSAVRSLPLAQRRQLLALTAASGSVANLRVVAGGPGVTRALGTAGCAMTEEVFTAAAAAGQLRMCRELYELGCPWISGTVQAAARAGHGRVVRALVLSGCPWELPEAAVACSSAAVMSELFRLRTARRFYTLGDGAQGFVTDGGSSDSDGQAGAGGGAEEEDGKDGWAAEEMLGVGNRSGNIPIAAPWTGDGLRERLAWMQQRGYRIAMPPPELLPLSDAAAIGELARQCLMDTTDANADLQQLCRLWEHAAAGGHLDTLAALKELQPLAVLEELQPLALWDQGHGGDGGAAGQQRGERESVEAAAAQGAARAGRADVLTWLLEQFPAAAVLQEGLWGHAAQGGGSLAVLQLLAQRGCPGHLSNTHLEAAVKAGCSGEAAQWMVQEHGCVASAWAMVAAAVGRGEPGVVETLRAAGAPLTSNVATAGRCQFAALGKSARNRAGNPAFDMANTNYDDIKSGVNLPFTVFTLAHSEGRREDKHADFQEHDELAGGCAHTPLAAMADAADAAHLAMTAEVDKLIAEVSVWHPDAVVCCEGAGACTCAGV